MQILRITEDYSVSGQIGADDVTEIAAQGYRSIMCNRPDGESAEQVNVAEIQAASETAGLDFAFVPVVSGQITYANVEDFAAALKTLPTPVLAYCRSGARCQNLFAMAQQFAAQGEH